MIVGAHSVIYSRDPDADRAFLRDVLAFPHVDAGGGWLIFGLPPSEVAVHPSDENDLHEFFLICEDVDAFVSEMARRGVACAPIETPPWGRLTRVALPGGGRVGVYQARHARPKAKAAAGPKPSPRTRRPRPSRSARAKKTARGRTRRGRPAKRAARRR